MKVTDIQKNTQLTPPQLPNQIENFIEVARCRTLVVKPPGSEKSSGNDIFKLLAGIVTTAIIKNIHRRRNHLEIVCRNSTEMECLKHDLQQHSALKSYIIHKKPVKLQKAILLSVPEGFSYDYINAALHDKYRFQEDEFRIRFVPLCFL